MRKLKLNSISSCWGFLLIVVALSGCMTRSFETSYLDLVTRTASSGWYTRDIDVIVPKHLTVSEENRYRPRGDIVWHGEPLGDRHAQVQRILEVAARNATKYLRGRKPVRIEIELETFHALSNRARLSSPSAVHNLAFKIRVFDMKTGRQIIPTDRIRADLPAFTRTRALEALRIGETQKVRITRHLEGVLKGWLQQGQDPRGSFAALGW